MRTTAGHTTALWPCCGYCSKQHWSTTSYIIWSSSTNIIWSSSSNIIWSSSYVVGTSPCAYVWSQSSYCCLLYTSPSPRD